VGKASDGSKRGGKTRLGLILVQIFFVSLNSASIYTDLMITLFMFVIVRMGTVTAESNSKTPHVGMGGVQRYTTRHSCTLKPL
jgi:hypothetical protein